jgi:hypothetical protein
MTLLCSFYFNLLSSRWAGYCYKGWKEASADKSKDQPEAEGAE